MDNFDIKAIEERLERANVGVIQRDGSLFYELDPRANENRWWAGVFTQYGHLSKSGQCNLAAFFQHAPSDIRALLEEVKRGRGLVRRMREVLRDVEWSGTDHGHDGICPSCLALDPAYTHENDCELAAVLSGAAKVLGEE